MPHTMLWIYRALTSQGKIVRGYVHDRSQEEASAFLSAQDIFVVSLTRASTLTRIFIKWRQRITRADLLDLFRQALYLCQSGMTMPEWLRFLEEHHPPHHALQRSLSLVRQRVLQGFTFSQSLESFRGPIDDVVIGLIHQGEQTGQMVSCLQAVVNHLMWKTHLRDMGVHKLRYPLILCVALGVLLTVFSVFLVPQWENLFASLNLHMGLWTVCVLTFLKIFPMLLISLCGVVVIGGMYTVIFRKSWMGLLYRICPVVLSFLEKRALYDWCHTMTMSLRSHLSLLDSVALSARVVPFPFFKKALEDVHYTLKQGFSLSRALSHAPLFPRRMVTLIHAAEQSQNLVSCFDVLTQMYADEVEKDLQKWVHMIEPIVLVVLGTVIGTLVLGLIYPLYQSAGQGI